ncbi:MAG: glycosyltransferase [Candidatus Rehaiarchaeum fermentans]|nr:glycosyltransferase [Candidatus Rehaiarchaeum fermentans]MCW1297481.1 glycosyltransferase [Candidatus Rehaiarchaeum fermentans]MCW1302322.1 glycosyltransferase [Candidatus Rehaiarchaeum fermentans]
MKNKPLISVIIPTYNEIKYLPSLLKSIKNQTYKKYEVIVSDYKSSDGTIEVAKKYGCKVLRNRKKGVSSAKNKGFRESKGEIVAFIDADYVLSKNLFEEVVKEFEKDKSLIVIEPETRLNIRGLNIFARRIWSRYIRFLNLYKNFSYSTIYPAAYGCVFIKRWAFAAVGGFDERMEIAEDIDLFNRIRKYGSFKMIKATAQRSMRRYIKQGYFKTLIKYAISDILLFFHIKKTPELNPIR